MCVSPQGLFPRSLPLPSDRISGLDWIAARHRTSGNPSVATMSFGGPLSLAMNDAVREVSVFNGISWNPWTQCLQLTDNGIHCTVAAVGCHADRWRIRILNGSQGNEGRDAFLVSPASTAQAITVGATDITDSVAWYSNFGAVVDVFAPGSNVTSTWIDGNSEVLSGTSMATPAVAGLVAYSLNILGRGATPAEMSDHIKQLATQNALSNIRE